MGSASGVDSLVERAGVSKPTLYAQFGSKENLVAAVLDRRRAAGLDRPDELADALQLLIDGANARVVVSGDRTAMLRAKAAATRLVKGATE